VSISENLSQVREHIARAASRVHRNPDEITLVAVSKTFGPELIRDAYEAGQRHFGENRVQEWEGKQAALADLDATWHLVGHLQSNKVRRAVSLFHTIDSVDSLSLAQKLDRAVAAASAPLRAPRETSAPAERLPILIEVRVSPELTKSGMDPGELPGVALSIFALPHLELRGFMTIPPLLNGPEDVRPYFRRLRETRDDLAAKLGCSLPVLSMGMSQDFEVAIEEGATQIRLGTAIFGERS
jgi:hypothetical protein